MARIMIADDDDSVRTFVRRALEMDGHQVSETIDGEDALAALVAGNGGHDLLLSDICMPRKDGIDLAKSVARRFPDLRIVLMTGFADQGDDAGDLGTIVRDIISKPFTLAQIRHRISEALNG